VLGPAGGVPQSVGGTRREHDQGIGWADSEGPFSLDGASGDGALEGCTPAAGCTFAINKKNDNEPYSFHTGGGNFLHRWPRRLVSETIPLLTLSASSRAGGEVIPGDAF
jgi:hypothetical protein